MSIYPLSTTENRIETLEKRVQQLSEQLEKQNEEMLIISNDLEKTKIKLTDTRIVNTVISFAIIIAIIYILL